MYHRRQSFLPLLICLTASTLLGVSASAQERSYTGLVVGQQRYQLDDLNAALAGQQFPTLEESSFRIGIESQSRKPGRHVWSGGLQVGFFEAGDARISATDSRATSAGVFEARLGYGFDLLYPSAWDLLLGATLGTELGRIRTTVYESAQPAVVDFAGTERRNDYNFALLGITPTLTLQSIPFNISEQPTRVFVQGGYRIGSSSGLSRTAFPSEVAELEVGPRGVYLSLGFLVETTNWRALLRRQAAD